MMVSVSECACGKGGMMSTAAGKKIAIVTGSALGLGYELTRQLIAKGWFVAGIDFNGARQAELSKTFAADEYRAFVGDISEIGRAHV